MDIPLLPFRFVFTRKEGGVVPSTWDGIAPLQEAVLIAALALLLGASSDQKVPIDGKVPQS